MVQFLYLTCEVASWTRRETTCRVIFLTSANHTLHFFDFVHLLRCSLHIWLFSTGVVHLFQRNLEESTFCLPPGLGNGDLHHNYVNLLGPAWNIPEICFMAADWLCASCILSSRSHTHGDLFCASWPTYLDKLPKLAI